MLFENLSSQMIFLYKLKQGDPTDPSTCSTLEKAVTTIIQKICRLLSSIVGTPNIEIARTTLRSNPVTTS
jgi:hypothetical protein